MEDFDITLNMNGNKNELHSNFDISEDDNKSKNNVEKDKKSWINTLNTLTSGFKKITDYKTNEEAKAQREKELAQKGTKYKVLGMNPLVAIGISFAIIISGSIVLTKIK